MVINNSEHFFYTCDGASLKSINEMFDWMKNTSDKSFFTHINSGRNDFAGWTKTVLKDSVLSKNISGITDRKKVIDEVEKRVSFKSRKKSGKKKVISQIKKAHKK